MKFVFDLALKKQALAVLSFCLMLLPIGVQAQGFIDSLDL